MVSNRFRSVLWIATFILGASVEALAAKPYVDNDVLSYALVDIHGQAVGSDDSRFTGKVVFVDIFGTWCPPCLQEIPTLRDLHARYASQGLVIVAIAFEHGDDDDERRRYLRQFTQDNGIKYLVLDGGKIELFHEALPDVRNARGFPIEIFIDRSGAVIETRNGYGARKGWAKKLEEKLAALLAEELPATGPDDEKTTPE